MTLAPDEAAIRAAAKYLIDYNNWLRPDLTEEALVSSIEESLGEMTRRREIRSMGTAGYELRRDGEGHIDLWVDPKFYRRDAQAGVTRMGGDAEGGSVAEGHSTRSPEAMRPDPSSSSTAPRSR